LGTICFYFCVNNKLVLIFGLLIYRGVVPIMWAATFSNGVVDEKDVIIMTQMRQINDCIIRTVIVCNLLKSNL